MNAATPRPPSDDELDRLLGSKLRRTSPEFELRWRTLRADLAGGRTHVRLEWPRWLLWPGLATLALAGIVMLVSLRHDAPSSSRAAVRFEELLALDAALQPASTLLDPENRDAVIHLPAQPRG